MLDGFKDVRHKNPFNYTRTEWQQAARTGQNPKAIKATLQECWATWMIKNHSSRLYKSTLLFSERRGYVVVDIHSEVYSLTRQLGIKKKELIARIGKADKLPSVRS